MPRADAVKNLPREREARAGHRTAAADRVARAVEIARLAQEPQRVARGYPVVAVVFGVAVAGGDLVAVGQGLIHVAYVIRRDDVVGVKDEVRVVLVRDVAEQEIQRVALADVLRVKALKHLRTVTARRLCGAVGAVVGGDIYIDKPGRVVLSVDAVYQL